MTAKELQKEFGIGRTAFYRLVAKAGAESDRGIFNEVNTALLRLIFASRKSTGLAKEYFRVSVNEGYGWYVRAAGLTRAKATKKARELKKAGVSVIIRSCAK